MLPCMNTSGGIARECCSSLAIVHCRSRSRIGTLLLGFPVPGKGCSFGGDLGMFDRPYNAAAGGELRVDAHFCKTFRQYRKPHGASGKPTLWKMLHVALAPSERPMGDTLELPKPRARHCRQTYGRLEYCSIASIRPARGWSASPGRIRARVASRALSNFVRAFASRCHMTTLVPVHNRGWILPQPHGCVQLQLIINCPRRPEPTIKKTRFPATGPVNLWDGLRKVSIPGLGDVSCEAS